MAFADDAVHQSAIGNVCDMHWRHCWVASFVKDRKQLRSFQQHWQHSLTVHSLTNEHCGRSFSMSGPLLVELATTDCLWCIIDTDSVLRTTEDFSVFPQPTGHDQSASVTVSAVKFVCATQIYLLTYCGQWRSCVEYAFSSCKSAVLPCTPSRCSLVRPFSPVSCQRQCSIQNTQLSDMVTWRLRQHYISQKLCLNKNRNACTSNLWKYIVKTLIHRAWAEANH